MKADVGGVFLHLSEETREMANFLSAVFSSRLLSV
jgi:hypothetical protein